MAPKKKSKTSGSRPAKVAKKKSGVNKNTSQKNIPRSKLLQHSQISSKLPDQGQQPSITYPAPTPTNFPIVGIGASAGGLEAFEEFFMRMPSDSGLGFVVVSHRASGGTNLLPGLLQKFTAMPVMEATDGLAVKPNTVYLNVAGKSLALLSGSLQVMDTTSQDRLPLPIDYFFRSLAEDQKHRAIGIILSGMGSDGTLGLKAIKGESGMTMVQDPQTSKYDGMPRSAMASGSVDYVCHPAQMPAKLLTYIRRPYLTPTPSTVDPESDVGRVLQKIFVLLRDRMGNDFSLYKTNTIRRRIERRMNVHQIETPKQYFRYLLDNPHEVDALFQEMLIGVTSFFRDPAAFDILAEKGLPFILDAKPDGEAVRVWVPGCGTGEEAYSLAMLISEYMTRRKVRFRVQIFGTDLDARAIEVARKGVYPAGIVNDVTPERLEWFFSKEDNHYRVKKVIRDLVIFAPHNLLAQPPFLKVDLLSCRNLLIYLEAGTQCSLFPLFHYALNTPGLLFLGSSETLGEEVQERFEPLDRKWKVYRRKAGRTDRLPLYEGLPNVGIKGARDLSTREEQIPTRPIPSIPELIEQMLLEQYGPACVIVNARGEIVYIHGRTGLYLEPAPGQPNLNLVNMAREALRHDLITALHRVMYQNKEEAACPGIQLATNGNMVLVDLTVKRIKEPEPLVGLYLVAFESRSAAPASPGKANSGKANKKAGGKREAAPTPAVIQELHFTKQRLQRTVEELQTANEELKSTNEELQSTNEELQSTNEELETSKEELQSLNEELVTVNAECEGKIDELSAANDDLHNLLNSTEIATVFLDNDLNIKRFTPEAKRIINLIVTDIGRPLTDISSKLLNDRLIEKARAVLQTLVYQEGEVQSTDGKWYLLRIFPYRTSRNTIEGLVITFLNMTEAKKAEIAARHAQGFAEGIIQTVRQPLLVLDGQLRVVTANHAFCQMFELAPKHVEKQFLYQIGAGEWNIPALHRLLEEVLPHNKAFQDFLVDRDFARVGRRVLLLNGRRLTQESAQPERILLVMEEVTAEKTKLDSRFHGHEEEQP